MGLVAVLKIHEAVHDIRIIQVIESIVLAGHFPLGDSGFFGDLIVIAKLIFTQYLIDELASCAAKFLLVKMQDFFPTLFSTVIASGRGLRSCMMDLAGHGYKLLSFRSEKHDENHIPG
jgi:hypothetical protein